MKRILVIIALGVTVAAMLTVTVPFDTDGDPAEKEVPHIVTFSAEGGSGGYTIRVLPDASYYMPSASLAHVSKNGHCLVGWSSGGQFHEIGSEMKGIHEDSDYVAVWMEGTSEQVEMGAWSESFTHDPCEISGGYDRLRIKSATMTVTNYPGTIRSTGQIERDSVYVIDGNANVRFSFTPSAVGTYIIQEKYTVRYSSGYDSTEGGVTGEFNYDYQTEREHTVNHILTFVDPSRSNLKEISWIVDGNITSQSEIIGNTVTAPSAGGLAGTEDLAWWTVNYYGTGDIYILPGTEIPVEDGKNLVFTAKMNEPGQGAIGYDFRGGHSSTVQIANVFDIGGEIVLPSDVTLEGYHLAGWTSGFDNEVLYLPGTVIGPSVSGISGANTDSGYIEMRAVWIKDTDSHHTVTFQNTDNISVSSEYVPHGSKVFLPVYGFDSPSGKLGKWILEEGTAEPGSTVTVGKDMVIDAKFSGPVSPYGTCTVIFSAGEASSNMVSRVFETGDTLTLPKVDKAYNVFQYWYESSGKIWKTGDEVVSNLFLNAKWQKIFDLEYNGNTVTVRVSAGNHYDIDWGDGTFGDQNCNSHNYAEDSRGRLVVTMRDGNYAGESAWAIYQVGSSVQPQEPSEPEPKPEPGKKDRDHTAYYIAGAVAAVFGIIIARRFI